MDQAGWMHGDVKPSNIFLSPQGHLTLLDLGFARHRDEAEGPRAIFGTGYYIAPEHFTARCRPHVRSDIYSLGVVLYQLLAGRLPLEGETLQEVAAAHKQTAPVNLRPRRRTCLAALPNSCSECWPRIRCAARNRRPNWFRNSCVWRSTRSANERHKRLLTAISHLIAGRRE